MEGITGDFVQLSISDTGRGMDEETRRHIFEPFYRGTTSRRTRHDGYGLGLSICDHIVRAHGGNSPAIQHRDSVRSLRGREPVGNDERRPPAHQGFQRLLHHLLRLRVERAGRLVE